MKNIQPKPTPDLDTPDTSGDSGMTSRMAHRINEVVGNSQDVLVAADTMFPFTLFPHSIVIDREKVTIVNRTFFRTAEIVSIKIEDVLNVTADVGPFFGAVEVETRFFDPMRHTIKFLRRNDALKVKRILQGYVVALKKNIVCSGFSVQQLTEILDDLGQGHPTREM
jgi:hypothetical protein